MTFEVTVNWHDPHEACKELRRLDIKFNTEPHSPLHHDNRCQLLHGSIEFDVVKEIEVLLQPVGTF